MRSMIKYGRRFLLLLILVASCLPAIADITAGPLTLVLDIPPGGSGTGYFKVANDGTEAEEVTISLADWSLDPNGNIRISDPGTEPRSLADWIEYSPATFKLEPGQVQQVEFTISVPSREGGDHWALFFVEGSKVTPVAKTTGELQTAINVKVRYGIKVFQHDPSATKAGRITGMELLGTDPLRIKVEFANTGETVLWNVTGRVEIRDVTGATVRTLEIEGFTVLPGGKRELILEDKGGRLAAGDYIALAIIDFGGDYLVGHQLQFRI